MLAAASAQELAFPSLGSPVVRFFLGRKNVNHRRTLRLEQLITGYPQQVVGATQRQSRLLAKL